MKSKQLKKLIDETILTTLEEKYFEYSVTNSKIEGDIYTSTCSYGKKSQTNTVLVHRRPKSDNYPYWLSVTENEMDAAKAVAETEGNDRTYLGAVSEDYKWCVLLPIWKEVHIIQPTDETMRMTSGYIESQDEFGGKVYTWCLKGSAHHDVRNNE